MVQLSRRIRGEVKGFWALCICLITLTNCAVASGTSVYDLPGAAVSGVVVDHGIVWFSDAAELDFVGHVGKILHGKVQRIPVGSNVSTRGIALASHGVWFTASVDQGNRPDFLEMLSFETTHTRYSIPTRDSRPGAVAVSRNGTVYFTEENGNAIGELRNKRILEYRLPGGLIRDNNGPISLAIGPDGDVWFIDQRNDRLGVLSRGTFRFERLPAKGLTAIAFSRDRQLWVVASQSNALVTLSGRFGARPEMHKVPWGVPVALAVNGSLSCVSLDGVTSLACYSAQRFHRVRVKDSSASLLTFDDQGQLWYVVQGVNFGFALRGAQIGKVPTMNLQSDVVISTP